MDADETRKRADAALAFLVEVAADRGLLAALDAGQREALVRAAGAFLYPDAAAKRDLAKALRRSERASSRARREEARAATGIRKLRELEVFPTPAPKEAQRLGASHVVPPPASVDGDAAEADREPGARPLAAIAADTGRGHACGAELPEERKCYVCKAAFKVLHPFYDQLCPPCGDFNYAKREQTANLAGRTALITGARVKIGYHASMLLLRAGARVLVTTRFPRDAAERYAREPDFASFAGRLRIFGLDLRHTPSVEAFCDELLASEPRLDYVIHNACQTVRRPPGFYAHLLQAEADVAAPPHVAALLAEPRAAVGGQVSRAPVGLTGRGARTVGRDHAAALSQLELLDEDRQRGGLLFPEGELDADLQQRDLRDRNSWRLRLHEVSSVELLEVHLVNAIAPFVMNARLRGLMNRTPDRDKHIVNVSAMEGQFYRAHKTDRHPHTNMAKAALNMMTRTSAVDYARDGIHMNSVDTGWVTDEDPHALALGKREEHAFHPPLDVVDGAARIVDPVFHGANTGEHFYGLFFKDYRPTPW